MTSRVTPLVSSPARWTNTILLYSGVATPSQLVAAGQTYPLATHTSTVGRTLYAGLLPADSMVGPIGGMLPSRVEGLGLTPALQPVTPVQAILPSMLGPGMPAPVQSVAAGVVTSMAPIADDNHVPVAVNDTYSVAHDAVLSVTGSGVLANDTDADHDTLHTVPGNGPAHGMLT